MVSALIHLPSLTVNTVNESVADLTLWIDKGDQFRGLADPTFI